MIPIADLDYQTIILNGQDTSPDKLSIQFSDGAVELTPQQAITTRIMVEALLQFNINPPKSTAYVHEVASAKIYQSYFTIMYQILIDAKIDYTRARLALFQTVDALKWFHNDYTLKYMRTVSKYSIAKTYMDPEVQKCIKIKINQKDGSKVAETKINYAADQLNKVLGKRGIVKDNVFIDMYETGIAKLKQLQQLFVAYGCRADIDATIMKYIIPQSTITGLRNAHDFATEILSAKLSAYFNSSVIRDTQDFSRLLKLVTIKMSTIYPGDCGNRITIPCTIRKEYKKNYLYSNIIEGGKRIVLTPDIIDNYVDRPLQRIAPYTCRHTDGCCEYCAGRADSNILAYLPPHINIGVYSASILMRLISQRVLSNKHLCTTDSLVYTLLSTTAQFFTLVNDELYLNVDAFHAFNKQLIRINLNEINEFNDAFRGDIPNQREFSDITSIAFMANPDAEQIDIPMSIDDANAYLSEEAIRWIRGNRRKLITKGGYVYLPIEAWNMKVPMFRYTIKNYSVVKFFKSVSDFFESDISKYNSIPGALKDFTDMFFTKGEINIFYLDIIMKSFLYTDIHNYRTPLVTDYTHVKLDTLKNMASNHAISTKLSFLDVGQLFRSIDACVYDRPAGQYDLLFGL